MGVASVRHFLFKLKSGAFSLTPSPIVNNRGGSLQKPSVFILKLIFLKTYLVALHFRLQFGLGVPDSFYLQLTSVFVSK